MLDEPLNADDLLHAWREATLAAQLAERLARVAAAAVAQADVSASAAEQVADLAERTAEAALAAAERARATANDARRLADLERDQAIPATAASTVAVVAEQRSRDAYEHPSSPPDVRARN